MSEYVGRYRILRPLGEGGMGKIFVGEASGASGFARRVVVKVVKDELDADLKQSLVDEARLTSSLVHRNIVPVLDLEESGNKRLVILEYVDGLDLRQLLERTRTLPWALAVYLAIEVAAGLDYAHRHSDKAGRPLGIVHRDVSPANILLSWEGEVKLTDFGVAKFRRHDASGAGLKGNLAYMAPEQARGEEVDPRADVFALGVVLYEALVGNNPFRTKQDMKTLTNVREGQVPRLGRGPWPKELVGLLARATARDRKDRFATASELRDALVHLPDQPKDPVKQLVKFLAEQKPKQSLQAGALVDAVLGGGRPLTQVAGAKKAAPAAAASPSKWPKIVAGVLALVLVVLTIVGMWVGATRSTRADATPLQRAQGPSPRTAQPPSPSPAPRIKPTVAPAAIDSASQVQAPRPVEPSGTCRVALRSKPAGARLLVDGRALGKTPLTIELPCRTQPYRVQLALAGHAPFQREVTAVDSEQTVNAQLLQRGTLTVNAIPWADVFVDGRPLGHTPKIGVTMDPGRHTLKLVTSKGDTRTRVVDVQPKRNTKVTVQFAEP